MNSDDVIQTLAKIEGRKLKFDYYNKDLPNFQIKANRIVQVSNYEKHDNAPRMTGFSSLLNEQILPNISKDLQITNATFGIELHDSNSYLDNEFDYSNCMVWSRNKNDKKSILIPDYYHLHNYYGILIKNSDPYKYINKPLNKIGFYGSTTGNKNPLLNNRINTCIWSVGHRDIIDAYITNVVQINRPLFNKTVSNYQQQQITANPIAIADVFKYKMLLDIPGNTYSWDRVPMILNSNSLLFRMKCEDYGWYFPILHDGEHFITVDENNMRNMFTYYMNNQKEAEYIIKNANNFASKYLKGIHSHKYIISMFEESIYWNSP